jgi:hypothetical protein
VLVVQGCVSVPWEETEQYIRSGHENPNEFQQDSLRTFVVSQEEGIKAVIGKRKGKEATEIFSYLFDKTKGWTLDKSKAWYEKHKKSETVHERFSAILPFQILEKLVDKPLKIRGVALTVRLGA